MNGLKLCVIRLITDGYAGDFLTPYGQIHKLSNRGVHKKARY